MSMVENVRNWREHPPRMVRELFERVPDPWQQEALTAFPISKKIALVGSRGVGVSRALAWMAWNFMLTRSHPKIAMVGAHYRSARENFWSEIEIDYKRILLLRHLFDLDMSSLRLRLKDHPETWWMAHREWKASDRVYSVNSLAGLQSERSESILYLLDNAEMLPLHLIDATGVNMRLGSHMVAGGVPFFDPDRPNVLRAVYDDPESMKFAANGDPDDPNRSPRIFKDWARQQIEQFGREHPFVKVNVLGEWP